MYKYIPTKIAILNSSNSTVVPVIASFDPAGSMKPLYVRINNQKLKILSATLVSEASINKRFFCKVIDGPYTKEIILTFHRNEQCWTFEKDFKNN